ncbi:L-ribulose-5-phosphate 3-epimerase [Actinomyces sp. B33]|uniref:L-ribulose-5-phosphate 3-epimerase n=1 Tax=Actinomyces sp. B33 TaxID=2942131 RepID=UPI0023409749|nr:L-ribulose-5-phosphate 3-epimerase [Actinomyces sp. B33]MDC4232887.1 L-ribulose-5-phosphate 3-epimerase [Actinomyces sp. B33]
MTTLEDGIRLGVYEKALISTPCRTDDDWRRYFSQVRRAGFSFVDLSIDESPQRRTRLDWDAATCRMVRRAADAEDAMIGAVCLSIHRQLGPGSSDPRTRERARAAMADGLRVCHDLGVGLVQVAGYYCYYEDPTADAERWYGQMLADAVPMAARLGVVMGIENVDGTDVTSIREAMRFVDRIDSPWLQVYPDLGNIAEQGCDPVTELAAGRGHMVAIHAKDVRRGEPRRVDMGTGIVDWDTSFRVLKDQSWAGRLMIEMWNDDAPDSNEKSIRAREFIAARASAAGLSIVS